MKRVYIMKLCTIPEEVDDRTTWNGWCFLKKETGSCISNIYKIGVSVSPEERAFEICNIDDGLMVIFESIFTYHYLHYEKQIQKMFTEKTYLPCLSVINSGRSEFFRISGCEVLSVFSKLLDIKENMYK